MPNLKGPFMFALKQTFPISQAFKAHHDEFLIQNLNDLKKMMKKA